MGGGDPAWLAAAEEVARLLYWDISQASPGHSSTRYWNILVLILWYIPGPAGEEGEPARERKEGGSPLGAEGRGRCWRERDVGGMSAEEMGSRKRPNPGMRRMVIRRKRELKGKREIKNEYQ